MSSPAPAPASTTLPLAVDLDGTLIRGDVFIEAMLRFVFAKWRNVFILAGWLVRGRAYAKARLAAATPTDPALLAYDERVVAWLKSERAAGRRIALATASDQAQARAVAAHLGVFDDVFASDGVTNLKSVRKAERLSAAYPQGFVYAGNETADLKVWTAARGAVIANAAPWLVSKARNSFAIEKSFASESRFFAALARALRPQQWAKNLLVFVPLLAGQGWLNEMAWRGATLAFLALCCAASSIYLVNDASDIQSDRKHPRKRLRPFASGALSPVFGLAASVVLAIAAVAIGAAAGVAVWVAGYIVAAVLYSFRLKRAPMIDVFVLAGLYAVRVVMGGEASLYPASSWLIAFSGFFFLSLALVKRVAELHAMQPLHDATLSGRGYVGADRPILVMTGVAATFSSALVLALYIQNESATAAYRTPMLLWVLPAVCVFWLSRVWLLAHRGAMVDDPLLFAFRDRVSWLLVVIAGLAFAGAALTPF